MYLLTREQLTDNVISDIPRHNDIQSIVVDDINIIAGIIYNNGDGLVMCGGCKNRDAIKNMANILENMTEKMKA